MRDLETHIPRPRHVVRAALLQFAARRSYQIHEPNWHANTLVVGVPEAPSSAVPEPQRPGHDGRLRMARPPKKKTPALPAPELKRRVQVDFFRVGNGGTTVRFRGGSFELDSQLAYEIHAYLCDPRAYHCECPPWCPACSGVIRNGLARYCPHCGIEIIAAAPAATPTACPLPAADPSRQSAPEIEPAATARKAVTKEAVQVIQHDAKSANKAVASDHTRAKESPRARVAVDPAGTPSETRPREKAPAAGRKQPARKKRATPMAEAESEIVVDD